MSRLTLMFIAFAATLWTSGCVNDPEPPDPQSLIAIGDRVPQFVVTTSSGQNVTEATYAGSRWILTFFTTGCPDCRRALPELERFHNESPSTPMVCIARGESEESVGEYWTAHSLTLPYASDVAASVYHLFATAGVPRIFVVDERGTVAAMFDDTSVPTAAELAAAVNLR